jgi:hypothetical protein
LNNLPENPLSREQLEDEELIVYGGVALLVQVRGVVEKERRMRGAHVAVRD